MASTRRLAAILAADIVGYSRLMGLDEAGTAQAVREHRAAADPLIDRPERRDRPDGGRARPRGRAGFRAQRRCRICTNMGKSIARPVHECWSPKPALSLFLAGKN